MEIGIVQDAAAANAKRIAAVPFEVGFTVDLGEIGVNGTVRITEREMDTLFVETSATDVIGVWRGNRECGPDFKVRAELKCGMDGAWTYAFTYSGNASAKYVRRVVFPTLTASYAKDATVFSPYSIGRLHHPRWENLKPGAEVAGFLPNGDFRAMRFGAVCNIGIPSAYLDWRTPGYDSSNFECHKDREGKARMGIRYDLPFTDTARRASERVFTGTFREYSGSWWEATQIYRKWGVTQPNYLAMKSRRAEAGRLLDVSMWFWNRGEAEQVIAPVEKFADDAGVPVALDWYWWHKIPYDTQYPNFWPPREGVKKFRAAVERLKSEGIYTQVYINGVSRGEDDPDWANGGEDESWWWWPAPHPGMAPRRVVYNSYSDVGLVEMCGEAPVFQKKVREVVRHLVKDGGLDAVYIDQIGCTCHNPCFNPKHHHAPGDADAPTKGYVEFAKQIRGENPGVHFSTEDVSEAYDGLFDSKIVLCVSYERFGSWGEGCASEVVPAYQALYNDVSTLFGAYTMMDGIPPYDVNWPHEKRWQKELDWPALFPDQFAVELARSAVHGMQPCVHNFRIENAVNPRLKDDYDFMIATARCRSENAKFLVRSLLANPGKMSTATKTVKFCRRGTYNAEGVYQASEHAGIPAVMHSVWKNPEGEVRTLLVNWTREEQVYRIETPDVVCEGTVPARSWKWR